MQFSVFEDIAMYLSGIGNIEILNIFYNFKIKIKPWQIMEFSNDPIGEFKTCCTFSPPPHQFLQIFSWETFDFIQILNFLFIPTNSQALRYVEP